MPSPSPLQPGRSRIDRLLTITTPGRKWISLWDSSILSRAHSSYPSGDHGVFHTSTRWQGGLMFSPSSSPRLSPFCLARRIWTISADAAGVLSLLAKDRVVTCRPHEEQQGNRKIEVGSGSQECLASQHSGIGGGSAS